MLAKTRAADSIVDNFTKQLPSHLPTSPVGAALEPRTPSSIYHNDITEGAEITKPPPGIFGVIR